MARKIELTQKNLQSIFLAHDHFFPEGVVYSAANDAEFSVGDLEWSNRQAYVDDLAATSEVKADIKDVSSIRNALRVISEMPLIKNEKVEANRPSVEQLKTLGEEAVERAAAKETADVNAKTNVQNEIDSYKERVQKLKAAQKVLEKNKIYYEVKNQKVVTSPEVAGLKQQAAASQKELIKDAAEEFSKSPRAASLPKDEAVLEIKQAALTTDQVLINNSPLVEAAVFQKVVSSPEIFNKIAPDVETQNTLNDAVAILTNQKISQFNLAQKFTDLSKIDGYTNIGQVEIEISLSQKPNFTELDIDQKIISPTIENYNNQSELLESVKGIGKNEIRSQLLSRGNLWLDSQIAKLPVDSVAAKLYNSQVVRFGLSSLGIAEAVPVVAVEGSILGNFFVGSGLGQVAGFLQSATGLSFGVEMATGVAAATEAGVGVAAGVAAETAAGVTAEVIGAAAAPATAGISFIIATAATILGPRVVKILKDNSKIIAVGAMTVMGGLFGLVLGSLGAIGPVGGSILGAVGGASFGSVASGGLSGLQSMASTVGSGITTTAGVIWSTFMAGIATPILVSLVAIPVIVTFILFIINSGAYVVPQGSERSIAPALGPNQMGGLVSNCKESAETGPEITDRLASQIKNGAVHLLPETVWGRRDGICITPTMIIMHWSAGANDDPDGNQRTYETLIARSLSCQLAVDINDTWLMEKFFEKQVEFPACAGEWNTFSISNEMAGSYFTASPPPPNKTELELTYNATCKIMKQYNIPWSQIYGHYNVPGSGKIDPGVDFLEKVFIPEIKKRCPNGN